MKKLMIIPVVFFMNFLAVNAFINKGLNSILLNPLLNEDLSLWFGILSISILGLFTVELVKRTNLKKDNKNKRFNLKKVLFYA